MFLSKLEFSISRACGVKEVLRFLFFDVSTPMKSVKGLSPILNLLLKDWKFKFNFKLNIFEGKVLILPSFGFFHPLLKNGFDFLGTFGSYIELFKPKKFVQYFYSHLCSSLKKSFIKDLSKNFIAWTKWMPGHFYGGN